MGLLLWYFVNFFSAHDLCCAGHFKTLLISLVPSQPNFMGTLATTEDYRLSLLDNQSNFKNIYVTLNFNIRVNWKILKCGITRKRWAVEQNGQGFGPGVGTCRVLFMSDYSSSVCNDSVHFAKFPMFRFSKGYSTHSFDPISPKLYGKCVCGGGGGA